MEVNKFRLIWLFLLLFLLLGAIWLKIVPSGHARYSSSYPAGISWLGGKGFIGDLKPADRVSSAPDGSRRLIGDPGYFTVSTPRPFSTAKLDILYKPVISSSTPVIEAGVLADKVVWRYRLAPIQNSLLDRLMSDWITVASGTSILIEKEPTFSSLSSFIASLGRKAPAVCPNGWQKCLTLYNADKFNSSLPGYEVEGRPADTIISSPFPLLGAHQFYFYRNASKGSFSFRFIDLNRNKDRDPVKIIIYKDGKPVLSKDIDDNRGLEMSGQEEKFQISFADDSGSGLYKLEIKSDDDIVIDSLSLSASSLSAINRISILGKGVGGSHVWTDSRYVKALTTDPGSLQDFYFGRSSCHIEDTYSQFLCVDKSEGNKEIILSEGNVLLSGEGVFSFYPQQLIDPDYEKAGQYWQPSSSTRFVLADYESPAYAGNGWREATVYIDLSGAYREDGQYSFMVSVPGLEAGTSSINYVDIRKISIDFYGISAWEKIKQFVSNIAW